MRARSSPLIAILYALFLLGAQQAAFAHWISHIGSAAGAAAQYGDQDNHGDAPGHSCNVCVAYAALAAAPPSFVAPSAVSQTTAEPVPESTYRHVPARPAPPYASRAPPLSDSPRRF